MKQELGRTLRENLLWVSVLTRSIAKNHRMISSQFGPPYKIRKIVTCSSAMVKAFKSEVLKVRLQNQ